MINTELLLAAWLEKLQKKWDTEEYYYDVEEAKKVFKFVSKLTNDRGASRNFDLLEFQFEIITEILCVKRRSDGKRKHREAHINIPRKNGKSFLAAIIVVYLFFCQRHIFGALFILTANTTKQAGELYGTVEHFIKANKTLRRYCKITSSTKTIIRKDNGNKLMVNVRKAENGTRSMGRAVNNDNYNGFQRRRPGKPGNAALYYGKENRSRGSERPELLL